MRHLGNFHRRLVATGPRNLCEGLLLLVLIPVSLLYGVLGAIRGWCYDRGVLPVYRSSLPVISVGNLSVGGTGKTPCVDWLVQQFHRAGKRPAIVSRGYGGRFSGKVGIVSHGNGALMSATESGDEPYLLARRNPGCPVLIAARRTDAVKAIEQSGCADLIILDDGFQHRAVRRDLDLVLIDAVRPLGNGWPLPAGNLREFPAALARADILLRSRSAGSHNQDFYGIPTYNSRHRPGQDVMSLGGETIPLARLQGSRLLAFAGIADTEGFFSSLEKSGLQLQGKISFPDHVVYNSKIIARLTLASAGNVDALITTEKDAVKLDAAMFSCPCYQVPLVLDIDDDEKLITEIHRKIGRSS